MADQTVYLCAETGTLSGTTITLSGSVITGMLAAQLFADALSDGDTVTIAVADASDPTKLAIYSGVPFTASGTTLDLSSGTLLDSNGTLGSSVNVLGFTSPDHTLLMDRPALVVSGAGAGSSNQSISNGIVTKCTTCLGTPSKDNFSGWDATNKQYTIPVDGSYLLIGQVKGSSVAVGYFVLSNVTHASASTSGPRVYSAGATATDQEGGTVVTYKSLAAGDIVYLNAYIQGTGTQTVKADFATFLNILYMGN